MTVSPQTLLYCQACTEIQVCCTQSPGVTSQGVQTHAYDQETCWLFCNLKVGAQRIIYCTQKRPGSPIMDWASPPEPIMRVMHLVMQIHHYSSSSTSKS